MSGPSQRAMRRTADLIPRHLLTVACTLGVVIGLFSVLFLALAVTLASAGMPDPKAAFTVGAFGVAGVVGLLIGLASAVGLALTLPGTLRRVRASREAWVADVAAEKEKSGSNEG